MRTGRIELGQSTAVAGNPELSIAISQQGADLVVVQCVLGRIVIAPIVLQYAAVGVYPIEALLGRSNPDIAIARRGQRIHIR